MGKPRFIGVALGLAGVLVLVAAGLSVSTCAESKEPASKQPAAAPAGQASAVAARMGDKVFTLEEVDAQGLKSNLKVYQELYETRRQALDQMVADYLMDKEAKARGVSRDDLFKTEVTDKIQAVTDGDIQAWYDANQERVRNQPLEALKDRIRNFLEGQRSGQARQAFVDKLKQGITVDVVLDPPRMAVKVPADAIAMGPADAPVQLVEFSDYQ